jgi:hypothetical protein
MQDRTQEIILRQTALSSALLVATMPASSTKRPRCETISIGITVHRPNQRNDIAAL